MAGPSKSEKVDSTRLSVLFSRLKIKLRRQSTVPNHSGDTSDSAQQNGIQTSNPSPASTAPNPPTENAHEEEVQLHDPSSLITTRRSDLWQEAFEKLNVKDKEILGHGFTQSGGAKTLMKTVKNRVREFEKERSTLRIGDEEVHWRNCAADVVKWLEVIGDVGVAFAPSPASIIWSSLKVLLKAEVDRCEYLVAILKCAESVLPLVRRGAIYESVYLEDVHDQMPDSTLLLREALCEAYQEALQLLVSTKRALNENDLRRFLQALLHPEQGAGLLKKMIEAEARMDRDVKACEVVQRRRENASFRGILQSLEVPLQHVQESIYAVLETLNEKERESILDTLSKVKIGDQHLRRTGKRLDGSGDWLLTHQTFRNWQESSSSSILWLTGQVGAGKSILASSVIDNHQAKKDTTHISTAEGFAYFYYSKNDPELRKGDPTAQILGSFLRQLASLPGYPEKTFKALRKLRDEMRDRQVTYDVKRFKEVLLELVDLLPRTCLILDGLDEVERPRDGKPILQFLVSLVRASKNPVKIFISSRDETHINDNLDGAECGLNRIHIIDENHTDIKEYIRNEMQEIGVDWPSSLRNEVETTLNAQAGGMFQWVYIHVRQLEEAGSQEAVRQRLQHLPRDLDETYDELYQKNKGHDEVCLQRAVKWIMYTRRPLASRILLSMVLLGTNENRSRLKISEPLSKSSLNTICRHLIAQDAEGYWRFPHASVKEYFLRKHEAWILEAQVELAELSLLLLIEGFRNYQTPESTGYAGMPGFIDNKKTPDPVVVLRPYATLQWMQHMHDIQHKSVGHTGIPELFVRFLFAEGDPSRCSLQYRAWSDYLNGRSSEPSPDESGLIRQAFPPDKPANVVVRFSPRNVTIPLAEECLKLEIAKSEHRGQDLLRLAKTNNRDDMVAKLVDWGVGEKTAVVRTD